MESKSKLNVRAWQNQMGVSENLVCHGIPCFFPPKDHFNGHSNREGDDKHMDLG